MNKLIFLLILPECYASCEAYWMSSNSTTSYSSNIGLSEPINAISSLSYTIFGLIGLTMNNYSIIYYIIMNLFILLGLSSFFHHYYYADADWAYSSDIISIYLLSSFSLFYITCDHEYFKYSIINKLINLANIINCLLMLVSYKINYSWKPFLNFTIYGIITTQVMICIYLFIIKSILKYRVLMSSIWNIILSVFGYYLWVVDLECPDWMYYNRFNGHAIWHICISWSLFNVINITNICRYNYNQVNFIWKPLFKSVPWFLYVIILTTEKSNSEHKYTNIDFREISLLINKKHSRGNTIG